MEFDDVRAFVTVAETGSVSSAARTLHITQPAMTRRLQRLEASLGTALLDRRSRPVTLTAAGLAALERCRRLLQDIREVRAATGNGGFPAGELRIGVAHALTELTLSEPVRAVRRQFPKIALRLRTGWSRDLLKRVRTGDLEAAVILLPEDETLPADIVGTEMGKERLVVVGSREDGARRRKIGDLCGVEWILNPEGCAARAALRGKLARADLDMIVAIETYNYELQLSLVAKSRGLSLAPERLVRRSRMRSRLRIHRIAGLEFPLTIWLLRRETITGFEAMVAELGKALLERL